MTTPSGIAVNDIVGIITAVAALVTVYFAWRASQESKAATQAAKETVEVAAAAATEYVRWRHQDHLRAILHHIEDIRRQAKQIEAKALALAEVGCTEWRSPEQEHLDICMEGMRISLPKCRALARPMGTTLLTASDDERKQLVARMAVAAAEEVRQKPELYAPVMDPMASLRADRAMFVSDRQASEADNNGFVARVDLWLVRSAKGL